MRKTLLMTVLGTALLAAGVLAQPAGGPSFAEIAAQLESQGFVIQEMEHEPDGFEVKATDREGRRVKLLVDPATGQVLRREERARREPIGF